jgi:hypothetical protein
MTFFFFYFFFFKFYINDYSYILYLIRGGSKKVKVATVVNPPNPTSNIIFQNLKKDVSSCDRPFQHGFAPPHPFVLSFHRSILLTNLPSDSPLR